MTLEQVIETVALLGKHLRTYTPLLAAIGSTKGKIRRELIARTFTRLSDDENALHDVQKIVSNLTGINAGTEFSLKDFAKLPESWLANDMSDAVAACKNVGILDLEDLVNINWIIANWRKKT